jgi:excisionase family DNA binding protein
MARTAVQITPRLMSLKQAALYLGVSYRTMREMALSGRISLIKFPGQRLLRVERTEVDALVEASRLR